MKSLRGMRIAALFVSLLSLSLYGNCPEDTEKSFHLRSDTCDHDDDCDEEDRKKPWYFHYRHHAFDEDLDDPTDELEADTAWPGQREEYSDKLFR